MDPTDTLAAQVTKMMIGAVSETLNITLKVVDRGVRTHWATLVRKMKNRLKRAQKKHGKPTGFKTIKDRFMGDANFRAELEMQGWSGGRACE